MTRHRERIHLLRYIFGPGKDEAIREQNEDMRDTLDHIIRVCRQSRMQSRRIRWIADRARCGLDGTTHWKCLDLPKKVDMDTKRLLRLRAQMQNDSAMITE